MATSGRHRSQLLAGRYEVRVQYYQACSTAAAIDYEVAVRVYGVTRYFCGALAASDINDLPTEPNGKLVTAFTIW